MKVDINLDEENKENYIVSNLNNTNNNLEEIFKVEEVSLNNITEDTDFYCNNNSPKYLHNTDKLTATAATPSSSSNEKGEGEVVTGKYIANEENPTVDSLTKKNTTGEEKFELTTTSDEEHYTKKDNYNSENEHVNEAEGYDLKPCADGLNADKTDIILPDEVQKVNSVPEVLTNKDLTETSEEIVPIITKRTIIKTSPSDVSERSNKDVINKEHSERLEPIPENSTKEAKASPNQRNHKSSTTQHRVTFTEELPTKSSTLLLSSTLTSSLAQTNTSVMGGASNGDTNSGQHRHTGEQSSVQEKLNANTQEMSEDLQNVPPHIIIAEEVPTKEARAFGTRIER